MRDCGFYAISIVLLILFFDDGVIKGYESITLVLSYIIYIIVNWKWSYLRVCIERTFPPRYSDDPVTLDSNQLSSASHFPQGSNIPSDKERASSIEIEMEPGITLQTPGGSERDPSQPASGSAIVSNTSAVVSTLHEA